MPHNRIVSLFILFIFVSLIQVSHAQERWKASWVSLPKSDLQDYAVMHARNTFYLSEKPSSLEIDVSAVIRYKLYVNGQYLGQGPSNNDLYHYTYDTYDIGSYLKEGENLVALTVLDLGEMNPLRYPSDGLKFILKSKEKDFESTLNTGEGNWKVHVDKSYSPTHRGPDFEVISYFAMGGGERIDGEDHPWGWQGLEFKDDTWKKPTALLRGEPYGFTHNYGLTDVSLSERAIPFMDESKEKKPTIRRVVGLNQKSVLETWKKEEVIHVPANTEVIIWLDQEYLTKGHVQYTFSGGKGAKVEVSYAETLFTPDRKQGHRDEIEGKEFIGLKDIYLMDGGKNRIFEQLLYRTWRYIEVKIITEEEPLAWEGYEAKKFIYPFEETATFNTPFQLHSDIWEVGWRTALLCTDESYMDCPYYEQLQYIGDTRIQALISLYVSGDDRLMKNTLHQFAHSITDEGITESRYPASYRQYIPPYSLYWVNMLHDYHMHREDPAFIEPYLSKVAGILFWFENKLNEDFLLGPMPWWSYVDVVDGWEMASPPGFKEGGSIVLSLQFLYALQEANALFEYFGENHLKAHFVQLAQKIKAACLEKGWDEERGLLADSPEKENFSQHANIFGILSDLWDKDTQKEIFDKIVEDDKISKANIYFRFYLTRAAQHAGKGDYFIQNLQTWEDMLAQGLTTFAEHEQDTRSDCHAWSASPNFEFIHLVCGIQPSSAHFEEVLITPHPGDLKEFTGSMPHPKGMIEVSYQFDANKASIVLPDKLSGNFEFEGKAFKLSPGNNHITW
ncbi:alpha-L-rhamnosidase-related protein [Pleomorphovibrio marinus]|uniref:alpha-L-rhamnosidase-related protein n=1 Tax=Pleomorphovibrio marinus TaxID=2164132 RepID=UPI000E09FCBE|nr:alpha-L-rhamnosidase N-terminal domain-containing protein [Pleomorphovibrio marinus]